MSEIKYLPRLKILDIVPDFELKSTKNKTVSIGQFKQRKNILLYFFGKTGCKPCRQKLIEYKSVQSKIDYYNTIVLVASPAGIKELNMLKKDVEAPFEFLSDNEFIAASKFTYLKPNNLEPIPSLFIMDRFGALYAQWLVDDEKELPSTEEILKVLRDIEIECPECGYFPGST